MYNITVKTVQSYASRESFRRGKEYFDKGAVKTVSIDGNELQASVKGSRKKPYQVNVPLSGDLNSANCTCPYDFGGVCKHIVAATLEYLHHQDDYVEQPSLEDIVDSLDRDQMKGILVLLAGQKRNVADSIRTMALEVIGTRNVAGNGHVSEDTFNQNDEELKAAIVQFRNTLRLEDYDRVRSLSGDMWPRIRDLIIKQMADVALGSDRIRIYLREGMVSEAVGAVDESDYVGDDLLADVVDAAVQLFPEWCVNQCRSRAELIFDSGKSKRYHRGLRWVDKIRLVCTENGRMPDWYKFCQYLLDRYSADRDVVSYIAFNSS